MGRQYEVLGALAHGGLGWIHLARDPAVSDRWVVLKGLLDTSSEDAALAAVAERRFLAALDHPHLVNTFEGERAAALATLDAYAVYQRDDRGIRALETGGDHDEAVRFCL